MLLGRPKFKEIYEQRHDDEDASGDVFCDKRCLFVRAQLSEGVVLGICRDDNFFGVVGDEVMPSDIKLYNMDCMEAMKEMPDKAFDLAIVDPPYGIGDFTRTTRHKRRIERKYKRPLKWNNNPPAVEYFEMLRYVSTRQIIFGANYYNRFTGGALVWDKGPRTNTLSRCEIASLSFQKRIDMVSVYAPTGLYRQDERIHPCQKPDELYRKILYKYAKEGDKILDTHLGSGSIAIACYDMGFDLVGYEIDKDYYEAAVKRLENHKRQLQLF